MDNQETPLHFAAATGQTEVAQLLLSAGASVGAKSKWGDTPLHVAAQESQARMARLLLARGANPNARNKDAGDTPLHHAARRAGPPPDLAEVLERPAITGARAAALQVYLVLRAAGANPKAKNRLGEAPAEMAPRFEMEYALSRPVRSGP
jgi:cytohesin